MCGRVRAICSGLFPAFCSSASATSRLLPSINASVWARKLACRICHSNTQHNKSCTGLLEITVSQWGWGGGRMSVCVCVGGGGGVWERASVYVWVCVLLWQWWQSNTDLMPPPPPPHALGPGISGSHRGGGAQQWWWWRQQRWWWWCWQSYTDLMMLPPLDRVVCLHRDQEVTGNQAGSWHNKHASVKVQSKHSGNLKGHLPQMTLFLSCSGKEKKSVWAGNPLSSVTSDPLSFLQWKRKSLFGQVTLWALWPLTLFLSCSGKEKVCLGR